MAKIDETSNTVFGGIRVTEERVDEGEPRKFNLWINKDLLPAIKPALCASDHSKNSEVTVEEPFVIFGYTVETVEPDPNTSGFSLAKGNSCN